MYAEDSDEEDEAARAENVPKSAAADGEDQESLQEDQHEEKVILPERSKFNKFKEEIKQRESAGITGDKPTGPQIKVDAQCDMADVVVFEDYSVKLTQSELDLGAGPVGKGSDKFIKLQLLERKDGQKWFLWMALGKRPGNSLVKKLFPFFNKVDAMSDFEKKFQQKTENKWSEREFFVPHLGSYVIMSAEKEKQKLQQARDLENEIMALVNIHFDDDEVSDFLKLIWNLESMKKVKSDYMLDTDKLALGVLKQDRISRAYKILTQVQKTLTSGAGQ